VLVVPREDATVAIPDLGEHPVEPRRTEQSGASIELLVIFDEQEVRAVRRDLAHEREAVVEVVEHLDPSRLGSFERVLFGHARPATVVLTTPNADYNVRFESLPAGELRNRDHRFEWSRTEFRSWAERAAGAHGYELQILPVGKEDEEVGAPTQMAVFTR